MKQERIAFVAKTCCISFPDTLFTVSETEADLEFVQKLFLKTLLLL